MGKFKNGLVLSFIIILVWPFRIPQDVRVVLIHKPVKESNLAKLYRSIDLSSFMLKTLERLLNRFLRGDLTLKFTDSVVTTKHYL